MKQILKNYSFRELPKTVKFPSYKPKHLNIENGLVATSHWLADISWLRGLEKNRPLGLSSLQYRVVTEQVAIVQERMAGVSRNNSEIEAALTVNLTGYKEVSRENVIFHGGYTNNKAFEIEAAYISFKDVKNSCFIDVNYSAALFFDLTTKIFISSKCDFSPLVLKDKTDKIVFVLAPLNPERIKGDK